MLVIVGAYVGAYLWCMCLVHIVSTCKTSTGVNSCMPVFDLRTRRLRFGASRSRLGVTRDDPGRSGYRVAALVTSRRDLGAPERGRRDPNPKTGMLEMTPIVVFMVVDPGKRINTCLATPEKYVYVGSERKATTIKKCICFRSHIKKDESEKRKKSYR